MKSTKTMTREELEQYSADLKKMIHGLQVQLTKALEAVAEAHQKSGK